MFQGLFNYDNPVWRYIGKFGDLILLNVLWIVCSIPIFTIGASTTAVYYVTLKLVRDEDGYTFRSYFRSFKENFKQATAIWLLLLILGRIVIGVAQNDIHDIGKDIVVTMLRAEGFDVIDLGVDVKPERFVYAVETYHPDILLMSGLMGYTVNCMRQVVAILEERGLRRQVAVLVGGSVVNESTRDYVGADAACKDPLHTLQFCRDVVAARAGDHNG